MRGQTLARTSMRWTSLVSLTLALLVATAGSFALEPKPQAQNALWSGQSWGELQVIPAMTRSSNSVTARAIVRGGPAGSPTWQCSQYSGWVAAGTSSIYIIIPESWHFTNGEGNIRSIGGLAAGLESSAGDPPPYGWADRLSDTCYCEVSTWGASGGCGTHEVVPTFAAAYQQEFTATGASGQWVEIQAQFNGWAGVGWSDYATGYVVVIDETTELEDNDNDGMYDGWEIAHFGDMTTADEKTSYNDGDDISDLTEYQRWNTDTLDDDGMQYDPTAENADSASTNGEDNGAPTAAPACGSPGHSTMILSLLSLTLLTVVGRYRRHR